MKLSTALTTKQLFFDEDGFLTDPELWDEKMAHQLADSHGIEELTSQHWHIIKTLREHFSEYGAVPMFHHVSHVNHLEKHFIENLFHSHREAWLISGLPNPGEEAKTYM